LVFVEVRSRRSAAFGSAAETVTASKRRRIGLAAQHYLLGLSQRTPPPCRFDVVSIEGSVDAAPVQWLQNAFTLD
jgi:putative endonuclease